MRTTEPHDSRQLTVERNLGAILDGAERVLERGEPVSISAVAVEVGLSRPTVYAHFPDLERLLEALVERTVRTTMAAVDSAEPERGPAIDALRRLLAASWQELGRHEDIARASAAGLSANAMRRAHHAARAAIGKLIERGRREGAFRTDVTAGWLVTSCLALIHAAVEAVRAGELSSDAAIDVLSVTIVDLFAGPGSVGRPASRLTRRERGRSPSRTARRRHGS
jgi:TetR/AcrR family transcriptional regulator, mexCD-oprJ operon repressor